MSVNLSVDRFDIELRTREQTLRSSFEKQQLEHQQQTDYLLASKDEEISSLLHSLNELRNRSIEAEQRQLLLDTEISRRREIEDKLRSTAVELSEALFQAQNYKNCLQTAQTNQLNIESQHERSIKSLDEVIAEQKNTLDLQRKQIMVLEEALVARPPVDLDSLSSRIGFQLIDSSEDDVVKSWLQIETAIVESVRKAHSEAVESRIKEQEALKQVCILIH
jgi:uncharacterized coiled-coil protein SlyX